MKEFVRLINLFYKDVFNQEPQIREEDLDYFKNTIITKWKQFLEWLIKNWHIEEIKSEKKSGPDLNDYIKYIAETDDPVKTFTDLLK